MHEARRIFGSIKWTLGTIPNTRATGCMGGHFGVRVDGLNKVIIDAYNAKFPNPPTPVPLKPKYFYYTRFINRDKAYLPRRFLDRFRQSLRLSNNNNIRCDDLIGDACWRNPQKIPDTNATGFVISDGEEIYVRVDRANNDIIEAYNKSSSSTAPSIAPSTSTLPPLPTGWEELREPSGRVYYGNPALKAVQYNRPLPPLTPGWVQKMDTQKRFFYENDTLRKWQYEFPSSTQPAQPTPAPAPAPAPSVTAPTTAPSVAATPAPTATQPTTVYYYKVGDGDHQYNVASKVLEDAINSVCPEDKSSTCHTEMVRADPKEQKEIENYNTKIKNKPNGGGKKHRRTNHRTNRRNASRRTASRRTASRRTASRRTGKK